ncbi:MAG: aminotransferase class I/II-fold pyridoxal phosphate-dependent enzyme, partial [Brevinema sp.]
MSSLFTFPDYKTMSEKYQDDLHSYIYSRGNNPTISFLEHKLARLERGKYCKCTGSGMGAISAVLFTLLQAGDHVLVLNPIYGPSIQYLSLSQKNNIEFTHLTQDITLQLIEQSIQKNTKLIYFETPATMTFQELPIKKICDIAKKHGIITLFDNTCLTPLFQKPLTLGVDIVVHSLSKYIG